MADEKHDAKAGAPPPTGWGLDHPLVRDLGEDLGHVASRWETFFQHFNYSPTESDPETARRARALARITKAAFLAMAEDDVDGLERLAKPAREYLEREPRMVDASRFAKNFPEWHVARTDVVPEKGRGSAAGRAAAVVRLVSMIAQEVPLEPPVAAERIGEHLAFMATTPLQVFPLADFLAENGVRLNVAEQSDYRTLAKRFVAIARRRIDGSDRPTAGVNFLPRSIAQNVVRDTLLDLGVTADKVDGFLRVENNR